MKILDMGCSYGGLNINTCHDNMLEIHADDGGSQTRIWLDSDNIDELINTLVGYKNGDIG